MNDVMWARAYLLNAVEPPAPAVHAFVVAHGPVEAVERIRRRETPAAVEAEVERRGLDTDWESAADRDVTMIDSGGVRLLTPESSDWPTGRLAALAGKSTPPLALWIRGEATLAELVDHALAVVGARAATGYGEHVAAEFGYGLAGEGWTVVSGAAPGVDSAAHRGALAADGPTVAVLATGVDVPFPAGQAGLLASIATGGGLLVSEYPPGTPPSRHRHLARNRLVAALGSATIVVEAARTSTALTTAHMAQQLGRRVFGVPGPITSGLSSGVHQLLANGTAHIACSVEQVTAAVVGQRNPSL